MKKNTVCLLMTGCIAPSNDVYALQIKDADIRKRQYLEALKFYIIKTDISKIIFCDNSNAKEIKEITELALKNGKEFEWLSFLGNVQKTIENGKGYGEGEILKYACENSKILQTCKSLVKVTGRLKITNINLILKMARQDKNYINIFVNKRGRYFADTRFFIINISDFMKYLIDEFNKVDDRRGEVLEICYAKKVIDTKMQYRKVPTYIGYEGISGSTGLKYALTVKEKIYLFIKIFAQTIIGNNKIYSSMEVYNVGIVFDDDIWDKDFLKLSHKNIAIYGAGELGQRFYKLCAKYCKVIIWIDQDYKKIKKRCGEKIESPSRLSDFKVDYVVIAINNPNISHEVNDFLKEYISESEITWFNGYSLSMYN